jgi:hypothetical protein
MTWNFIFIQAAHEASPSLPTVRRGFGSPCVKRREPSSRNLRPFEYPLPDRYCSAEMQYPLPESFLRVCASHSFTLSRGCRDRLRSTSPLRHSSDSSQNRVLLIRSFQICQLAQFLWEKTSVALPMCSPSSTTTISSLRAFGLQKLYG